MNKTVRVLLVAVCGYGKSYLNEMKNVVPDTILEGIVDLQKEKLEEDPWIQENRIPVYTSLDEFYANHQADLAVISTPIHLHTSFVKACLEQGSNVLCEKPLCLTVEEALDMQLCANQRGLFLAVGYQRCYYKDVLAIKKEILSGALGAPIRFKSFQGGRRGMRYYSRNNWAGKISINGKEIFDSPLQNACAHEFQLASFFLGDRFDAGCRIESVEAECYRANPNIENFDTVALCAMTDRKVPIYFYTAHPIDDPWNTYGVYEFEKGTIHYRITEEGKEEFTITYKDGTERNVTKEVGNTNHLQKFHDAVECVLNGTKPVCTVYAELPHIEVVRLTQSYPIQVIDPSRVEKIYDEEREETCYIVRGLTKKMQEAADNWTLPGKLGLTF